MTESDGTDLRAFVVQSLVRMDDQGSGALEELCRSSGARELSEEEAAEERLLD